MSLLTQILREMATTNESAAYAKQLVRGEKYGPGIPNKLDRWFMDAMFTKHKDRFIPTDAALKQLKQAEALSENNVYPVYPTLGEAEYAIEEMLYDRAFEACEGAGICGLNEYRQLFIVGDKTYVYIYKPEYALHNKMYYYVYDSEIRIEEVK